MRHRSLTRRHLVGLLALTAVGLWTSRPVFAAAATPPPGPLFADTLTRVCFPFAERLTLEEAVAEAQKISYMLAEKRPDVARLTAAGGAELSFFDADGRCAQVYPISFAEGVAAAAAFVATAPTFKQVRDAANAPAGMRGMGWESDKFYLTVLDRDGKTTINVGPR